jgi:septum formation protein
MDDEDWPDGYVRRLAQARVQAVTAETADQAVLAADTIVVVDNQVLGRPDGAEDATRMLRRLSGRAHTVMTAVCLANPRSESARLTTRVERTSVTLAALSDAEIDWYVATGEPFGRAGGYAPEGLASRFVTRIEGSYSNAAGLPVDVVYQMCKSAGLTP